MQGQSVTYTKREENANGMEEYILTLKLFDGDDIDQAMDDVRVMVQAALERSRHEAMLECDDEVLPF